MIMAQGNTFQKLFIINLLEPIMVKQMLQYAECVAWECISNKIRMLPLHVFSYHVKSHLVAVY